MQIVIAIPTAEEMKRLETPVCGVPLLARVVVTALRSGGSKVLILLPSGSSSSSLSIQVPYPATESVRIETLEVEGQFDPENVNDWRAIAGCLDDQFLWMPRDCLADRASLTKLLTTAINRPNAAVRFDCGPEHPPHGLDFDHPAVVWTPELLAGVVGDIEVVDAGSCPGVSARPPAELREVEAELVRRSGKVTDGIYSRFNRKLCWPAVRCLSRTPITPNEVSFIGLAVGALAGACFAQGTWLWDVAGGAMFFLSGLFDEIDGMLARLKFKESAFGCWLETFIDYATYLFAFAGMTIGGYRRGGSLYVAVGAALLIGSLLCFFTISVQRKLAAATEPTEYYKRYLKALDQDSGNLISKLTRNLQFLLRKGVLIHYVLLFAVLNGMPVLLFLAAFGANAAWIVTLYLNRRLFTLGKIANQRLAAISPAQRGVER